MNRILAWLISGVPMAVGLFAQTFDVASIKPTAPDARGTSLMFQPPNGMKVSNGTVRMLITFAYDIRDFQLSGGPGWIGTDRFDILAKAEKTAGGDAAPDEFRKMTEPQRMTKMQEMRQRMQALLADRFQLSIHRETKEGSVYALVVAKGGAKVQEAKETGEGPQGLHGGRGELTGMVAPMWMLTNQLSGQLGRPVIDKTELKAKYDFKLKWTPDVGEGGAGPMGPKNPGEEPPPQPLDGPTIFTALQEQLGLKLESQKGPIEMIVIDRVEKPSEN